MKDVSQKDNRHLFWRFGGKVSTLPCENFTQVIMSEHSQLSTTLSVFLESAIKIGIAPLKENPTV